MYYIIVAVESIEDAKELAQDIIKITNGECADAERVFYGFETLTENMDHIVEWIDVHDE